jgi:glycosyltransferase involved in cell wall biosynthesis
VITRNDDEHLAACLSSLSFCKDIVVVDQKSDDRSREIAQEVGANVLIRDPVPVVEQLLGEVVRETELDWIFRLDPDEVCPPALAEQPFRAIENHGSRIGKVELPIQFYFCGEPLRGTVWGPPKWSARIFNRQRVNISSQVHRGLQTRNEFGTYRIEYDGANALEHYWADSFRELLGKHRRYIPQEASAMSSEGKKVARSTLMYDPARAFLYSLVVRNGWRDGWRGFFLSGFYAWYIAKSLQALREESYKARVGGE